MQGAKRDHLQRKEVQAIQAKVGVNPVTVVKQTPAHSKKDFPSNDAECHKCGKKGHFKSICRSKKGEKDIGKSKTAKGHELIAQTTVGSWTQMQYAGPYLQTTYYNPSLQSEIP